MTAVPLPRIARRHKPTPPLNHSAFTCHLCGAAPFTEHRGPCRPLTRRRTWGLAALVSLAIYAALTTAALLLGSL